ncbi:MAG TPA: hypothetical protein ENN39_04825 [Desulfonatronum sp.]|nr:hypothetical protein [Desulfonatronum sp.]
MSCSTSSFACSSLPFFGLGLDLGSVLARAGKMLKLACNTLLHKPLTLDTMAFRASGYDLLVFQGREIRGQ